MRNRIVKTVVLGAWTLALAACGGAEAPPAAGKVFFVSPKTGDTIKPMSSIEFGSTGATVAAVPPGVLTPEQVRAGMIHYHLGLDTDCLGDGVVIPKADPWIHFGDGKKVIEMSLTPGPHRLAVQAGDDMHRTLPGMCEVINVTVAP
ncbi:MAG: DUF4399 domain-containing protein [Acidobacteria bacterium]|nr:DUF4399 domain-containing protein [Acidobacteriota bacterium]MSO83122.1 DUF4399 domain-containing protein [Acidobacteriota bacterium]